MSFSSSQISNMLSRKRYEVRRGDTLSGLAERFMEVFPTLKRFSRSDVEDMIFNENSSSAFKDQNRNIILEVRSLELNFILEARRREFSYDPSEQEYVFTDEDRLAFALNESEFWEHFCRCDRDCGEFLRESMKEQGLSSLPPSMSLNHKIAGSCSHKDLMESVRRGVGAFKKAVKLDTIAENILNTIGFTSPSPSQIEECCKKLIEENHLNICYYENGICIPIGQITNLSTKFVEEFYKNSPISSQQKDDLKKSEYMVTKADEMLGGDEQKFLESLEKRIGSSLEYVKDIYKKLGLSIKLKENEKIFIPPSNIHDIKRKWSHEWNAVEKFWEEHKPNNGNGKDIFEQYWVWSHEYVLFKGISTSATKTEICDIKYTMHYMAQGVFSDEYAKKIVVMTKTIVKGVDYLLCEKDDSMKELIEPSTLYLFKSIDKSAQQQFLSLMLQVKSETGSSFQKFYITSGFRGPVEHGHTVIKDKLRSKTLKNYYNGEPTRRYCNAIADVYGGNVPDWTNIDEKAKIKILSIPKVDIEKAANIAVELMNNNFFAGTDHKDGKSLDFRSQQESYRLQELAESKGHYNYSDRMNTKTGMQAHVHITIK